MFYLVDLLGRYSNTPELLKRLKRTLALAPTLTGPPRPTPLPFIHKISQRLEPAVLDQIAVDYEAGVPTTELMTTYGLSKGAVLGVLRSRSVQMRNQSLTTEQIAEARRMYQSGSSLKAVGLVFGCDAETVRHALKRTGLQLRKPWERA